MPKSAVIFELADTKIIYERQVYTFFTMLGDLGGFNGAIVIFPAFVMSWYSEKMYQKSISM